MRETWKVCYNVGGRKDRIMIKKCDNTMMDEVLGYIGDDYGKCLYVYIDIRKYGMEEDFFHVWEFYDGDSINAIVTEYYGGFQVYSRDLDFDDAEVADFLFEKNAKLIFGIEEVINRLHHHFAEYEIELGTVGRLGEIKCECYDDAYPAPLEELEEVVKLVAADPSIGAPYGYDSLYQQYVERMQNNYGRNYVYRDSKTNEIACHAGTYAELPELAVIGGVITSPNHRGKGVSKGTLAALCRELKEEGKDVFTFFYIPSAEAMHYGVGFEKVGVWAKLFDQ